MKKSITEGFGDIKDTHFGPHSGCRALQLLCGNPPATNGEMLADALLERIELNWRSGLGKHQTNPSARNWKLRQRPDIAEKNDSAEVLFERDVVRTGGANWANQVPTSSGLLGPAADKRRSIDLVERKGPGEFELIELKIDSNTPLSASLEILDYGTLYVFSRINAKRLKYEPGFSDLLEARHIRLRVLAPHKYYESKTGGRKLDWLGQILQNATHYFAQRIGGGFQMDFGFDVFSNDFPWKPKDQRTDDDVCKMMTERHPLISGLV